MKWSNQLSGYLVFSDGYKVSPIIVGNEVRYASYKAVPYLDPLGRRKLHKDRYEAIAIESTQEEAKEMCELDAATTKA